MAARLSSKFLRVVADTLGHEKNPAQGLPKDYAFCLRCHKPIELTSKQFFPCDGCGKKNATRALVFRKEAQFMIDIAGSRVYHYSSGGAVFCQFGGEKFRRVLLMRGTTHPVGIYSTPAGHWDLKESAQMAAKREIEEETGLSMRHLTLVTEVTDPKSPTMIEEECRRGSDFHYWRFFIFACAPKDSLVEVRPHAGKTGIIGEADMIGWVPVPEVLAGKFTLIKPVGDLLGKYLGKTIPSVLPR